MEKKWPGLRIVHGRPRHPQSQGSVERANAEVSKLLKAWRGENGGKEASWAYGLQFVQFQINRSQNSGINTSPCEALYGKTASVGLETTSLPPSALEVEGLISEDAFDAMCAGEYVSPNGSDTPILHEETDPAVVSSLQHEAEPAVVSSLQDEAELAVVSSLQEEEEVHLTLDDSGELYIGDCGACSEPLGGFVISCEIASWLFILSVGRIVSAQRRKQMLKWLKKSKLRKC